MNKGFFLEGGKGGVFEPFQSAYLLIPEEEEEGAERAFSR